MRGHKAAFISLAAAAAFTVVVAGCSGKAGVDRMPGCKSSVTSVLRLGDHMWAATGDGLVRFPLKGGKPERAAWGASKPEVAYFPADRPLPGDAAKEFASSGGINGVRSLTEWKGQIAVGTGGGVLLLDPAAGKITRRWTSKDGMGHESVRFISVVEGRLWAMTIFGASRLDAGGRRWRNYGMEQGLTQKHAYAIANDGKDTWVSCINGGLVRFIPARDRWEAVPESRGLGNKFIYTITTGPEGIWLGTRGGVNLLKPPMEWDEKVCADGFTEYTVYALARTDDSLWFGTTYGLFHRDLKTGKQEKYTESDGLPSQEINSLTLDGKTLWIGTRNGLAKIRL